MDIKQLPVEEMSHEQLCFLWRFGIPGDERLQGAQGERVKERLFDEFGGFTPEISKRIGWGN